MDSPWRGASGGHQPPGHQHAWFPAPTSPPMANPGSPGSLGGPSPNPFAAHLQPAQPPAPSSPKAPKSSPARVAVLVAVAALLAAALGFGAGRLSSKQTPSAVFAAAGGRNPSVATVPAPLKGNEAEPVQEVARILSPAVVQLQTPVDLGSGVIYDASGLILTAAHVVEGHATMQVRMADGTQTEGTVLGADPSTDIAVVRIDVDKKLPVAVLALGSDPQVGQMAIAIGSPYGLDQTVTSGIVSAVGRAVQTPGGEVPMIQTDAPINPGNSGGALADRLGRVIGINDSIISGTPTGQEAGNVGVGFAIPITLAKDVADRIVEGKPLTAGYLGVRGTDATGSRSGALIVGVEPDSPAANAGVIEGDVVVQIDQTRVGSMVDLAAAVRTRQPGDTVTLKLVRDDREQTVKVVLGKSG